jgi:hypothetical protein
MQRVALAKRCFAEPGPYQAPVFATAPALQRTAPQVLRAAPRPGHKTLMTQAKKIFRIPYPRPLNLAYPAHVLSSEGRF